MDTAHARSGDPSASLSAHVIKHPAYKRALESLRGFLDNAFTARGEARCALLSGPARCGKTTVAQVIEAEVKARFRSNVADGCKTDAGGDRVGPRTLFVQTPSKANEGSLAETILLAAGDPVGGRGTRAQKTMRVAKLLSDLRVELLVLDEFHHLVTSKNEEVAFEAAEWVKTLLNVGVCPILLVGIERARVVLDTNPQLQGRCWSRPVLSPFGWSSAQEQGSFRKLLNGFGNLLKMPMAQPLDSPEVAEAMHRATGGAIGDVALLLEKVLAVAAARNQSRITLDLLADAYDDWIGEKGVKSRQPNPFRLA